MSLRALSPDMDAEAVAGVDAMLDRVAAEHGVRLPLAIESGSRAWGFASRDSDYDCRFIFVRPIGQHLTPWPLRDVIEFPPAGELDVNGWDLGKALRLLVKGNAVVIEWLQSPIVYRGEAWFRDGLLDLARRVAPRASIVRHYLHLGRGQQRLHLADAEAVVLKKVFYTLRPAMVLRWLRMRPQEIAPPMHFPTLVAESDPQPALLREIDDLLARKRAGRESGRAPLPPETGAFIEAEFALADAVARGDRARMDPSAFAETAAFYRAATLRLEAT